MARTTTRRATEYPRHRQESELKPQPTEHPAPGPRQGRVLVLDSDRQIRALISEWIERAGYASVQAPALVAARESAAQCDIVLVDVRAPLPAARQMIANVQAVVPHAVVIAMSADGLGNGPADIAALERELGIAAVLVKPFDRDALTQALERASTWHL
jgi:DNA-binding NtrC family response regulator